MYCEECSQKVSSESKFCSSCGSVIKSSGNAFVVRDEKYWQNLKIQILKELTANFEKWEKEYRVLPDLLDGEESDTWDILEKTKDNFIWSDFDLEHAETLDLTHLEPGLELTWTGSKYIAFFDDTSAYFKVAKKAWREAFELEVPYWVAAICLACSNDSTKVSSCNVCEGEGEWKFEL